MTFRQTADAIVASTRRLPAGDHDNVRDVILELHEHDNMSMADIAYRLRDLNLIVSERTIRNWAEK